MLTGEETTWRITGSGRIAVRVSDGTIPDNATCICTHFKGTDVTAFNLIGDGECSAQLSGAGGYREIGFYSETYTTLDAFKTFVANQYTNGTPVCVWYVLATPTTDIVNEPIRKIGTYADEVSGITIPTIAGANAIDVDTTLKPSEVSVNYHGWHPVSAVHERENGAWTE